MHPHNPFKKLSGGRIFIPIVIGLGVIGFLMYKNFEPEVFDEIQFNWTFTMYMGLAFLFMILRDLGYMYRIRILTDKELNWIQSFRVIMLWEFSSALLPSAVGGTTVAMIYVNKEGINFGRSTAVVMATSFLDEIFFIIMFPLVLVLISIPALFSVGSAFLWFAVVGYSLKLIYTILLGYGLFINPRGFKWLLLFIFKLPFLRKYRAKANTTGNDIITSSEEFRRKSFSFWFKAFMGTFFSWSSRYFVVNALLLAFFAVPDHFLVFARQLVISNMLLIFPTPGASGASEVLFIEYLKDLIPLSGFSTVLALLWRLVSYYPYLLIGAFILPWWIKTKFSHHRDEIIKAK